MSVDEMVPPVVIDAVLTSEYAPEPLRAIKFSWRVVCYDDWMEPWLLAVILKPFFSLLLFGVICLGIRWLVWHKMPESRLKQILLKHRWGEKDSLSR